MTISEEPVSRLDAVWKTIANTMPDHASEPLLRVIALQALLGLSDDDTLQRLHQHSELRAHCGLGDNVPSLTELASFRNRLYGSSAATLERLIAPRRAPLLSIVSPVFRAKAFIAEFVREAIDGAATATSDFEIVLVEDGSDDETWAAIEAICAADPRVRGLKLSRNFGQHKAITAGLAHARGEYVVVMDSDLQDDPAHIPELLAKAREGHDVVLSQMTARAHSRTKNVLGSIFSAVLNRLASGPRADPLIGGYSILSRRAVDAFLQIRDVHRHYLVLLRWLGFSPVCIPTTHRPRRHGKTSYSLEKLARHALDGWLSHSNRLLYASVAVGFSFLLTAIAGALLVIVLYFVQGFAPGWPSLVVLILVCTAAILISLGVLGIYVGKIFDQVRARPLFIVQRSLNDQPAAPNRSE
ncbi:MAG TPA: glycosyltransferase family 2 protein [Thermoanaerobaculia bacterium]|nr:glycosyltransferase family 2 protein [Thermoanaerobaculia bacterium]